MRVRAAVAVFSAAFLAWLSTFIFNCYYHGLPLPQPTSHPRDDVPPFPGERAENIVWFLQVSDIHVSVANGLKVVKDFTTFCSEVVSTVNPALVLVTGDLTHAKYEDGRRSKQFEQEWEEYARVLRETGVASKVPWLDIRGNHDAFDVNSDFHHSNKFLKYSSSWKHHNSLSYRSVHKASFGTYSFLALDACPSPGPKRPFNFFGIIHDEDLDGLRSIAAAAVNDNQTLWLSHYPSSTIMADHSWLRELMSHAVVHVCGHLHTLGNLFPRMYGRHPSGHLELELGDFAFARRFRLMAYDHDLLSFTDQTLNEWPLVLVTNPKNAQFSVPSREPTGRIWHSTHVRIIAFSTSRISLVQAWVDGVPLPSPTLAVGSDSLYTTPWDPERFAYGLHTISVCVKDFSGRVRNVTHKFSLDGTLPSMEVLPQLLVLSDLRSLMQMSFLFLWLWLVVTLFMAWANNGKCHLSHFQPLVRSRAVFYPLMVYILYIGIGPWYVGEVLTGVYGLVSVHGVRVDGHFIPGSMTYLHGYLHVLLFQLPVVCYLNHLLSTRDPAHKCSLLSCPSPLCHTLFVLVLLLHCTYSYSCIAYGVVALVISPGVTWVIPLVLFLAVRAMRTRVRLTG